MSYQLKFRMAKVPHKSRVPLMTIAMLAAAIPAVGAESDQDPDQGQLREVVVTAAKRTERLQDVPEAVTAITGDVLAQMGADTFADFARTVPGLTFTDAGAGRQTPALRGVNATVGARTVGYYIGETPFPDAVNNATPFPNDALASPYLVDIDRIEVLRGPQGTLYGAGSMGGTIKLVPTQPNLSQFEGSIEAKGMVTQGEGGASPGFESTVITNVPIVQGEAGLRVVAWDRDIGGFIDRTYGSYGSFGGQPPPTGTVKNIPDEHTWGFRALGLYKPIDALSVTALAYVQQQHFDGFGDITGGTMNPGNHLVQIMISDVPEPQVTNFGLFSLTADYEFGPVNVVSSTSYSTNSSIADMEGTSAIQYILGGTAFPNAADTGGHGHEFTEELRLASSRTMFGFDWVVGVYYSDFGTTQYFQWAPSQYNSLVADNDPTNPVYAQNNVLFNNGSTTYERDSAQFGELTYHITSALSATAGIRHFTVANGSVQAPSGLLFNGADIPQTQALSARSEGNVHKGNLSYKLTPDDLVYITYSEGFRPGFGNAPLPQICGIANAQQVNPDSTKNYELGAKSLWLDKRLSISGAIYRIDWSNIQQDLTLGCGFPYAANFGNASIKGVELETSDQLTRNWSVGASGTYISAKLNQGVPTLGALAGDQIQNVPNWQFSLFGQLTYPAFKGADGYTRLDFQYTGSSWGTYTRLGDGERDPDSKIQVVRLLNLKTGIHYGSWEFSLAGQNLLNQVAVQSVDASDSITLPIPGRPRLVVTRPRTFFATVLFKF